MHNRENTEPVKMTETEGGEYPFLFSDMAILFLRFDFQLLFKD